MKRLLLLPLIFAITFLLLPCAPHQTTSPNEAPSEISQPAETPPQPQQDIPSYTKDNVIAKMRASYPDNPPTYLSLWDASYIGGGKWLVKQLTTDNSGEVSSINSYQYYFYEQTNSFSKVPYNVDYKPDVPRYTEDDVIDRLKGKFAEGTTYWIAEGDKKIYHFRTYFTVRYTGKGLWLVNHKVTSLRPAIEGGGEDYSVYSVYYFDERTNSLTDLNHILYESISDIPWTKGT